MRAPVYLNRVLIISDRLVALRRISGVWKAFASQPVRRMACSRLRPEAEEIGAGVSPLFCLHYTAFL